MITSKAECPKCFSGHVIVDKTDYGVQLYCSRYGSCMYQEEIKLE